MTIRESSGDGSYTLASPPGSGHNWGRPELIRFLVIAAREWVRRHPDAPRFRIGDMSKPDGSKFPPHKTHRDGLTLDLVTRPHNICHVRWKDQELTAELAQLLEDLGARQILYNGKLANERVKVCKPYPKHDDHFHIVIDPKRVPSDLGPVLMPVAALRDGAAAGWAQFGKPRRSPPRTERARERARGEGLRLAWSYIGEARGWQKRYRVELEPQGEADSAPASFDSGEIGSARTWHLVPGAWTHGQTFRWRVTVWGADDTEQHTRWQTVRVDLEPPRLEPRRPRADASPLTAGSRPSFAWRYRDDSAQRNWRVEVRKRHGRRAVVLAEGLGGANEAKSAHPLPKGRFMWRVVATDAAGNRAESAWEPFAVE